MQRITLGGDGMIYFDNAATTRRKPEAVIAAVVQALQTFGNSGRGAHEEALEAARTIYQTREALAALFGCPRADHVVFTANATEALNTAICGLVRTGSRVITTQLEHNSVLRPLYRLRQEHGVGLDFLQADAEGEIDYGALERLLQPDTGTIVTTHASNLTGTLLDIGRIGAFAHAHGLTYIVDASQTAGTFPIDMQKQKVDVLCFSGHKGMMAPQGTGALLIGQGVEIAPFKVGGTGVQSYSESQPREYPTRLEAGTLNAHGIAGLLAAVTFIRQTGVETIHAHELALTRQFAAGVSAVPGVTVYGHAGRDCAPVVSLNIGSYPSSVIADELAQGYDIAVRSGAHCAPLLHRALGTVEQGAVRFSFGYYNTCEEVSFAVEAVRRLAQT